MADEKAIHAFAVKWCGRFRDPAAGSRELAGPELAEDCRALGFWMDGGEAFCSRYGQDLWTAKALDREIDRIHDAVLLGSAVYSHWRYFNHWAYDPAEILRPQNRAWFLLALGRMALLTGENPFLFQGCVKRIVLVSDRLRPGIPPEPYEETEQRLTIDAQERAAHLAAFRFGDGDWEDTPFQTVDFRMGPRTVRRVMRAFSEVFRAGYTETLGEDAGCWWMELVNTAGESYHFRGTLGTLLC